MQTLAMTESVRRLREMATPGFFGIESLPFLKTPRLMKLEEIARENRRAKASKNIRIVRGGSCSPR
jgi:hypothetical protein